MSLNVGVKSVWLLCVLTGGVGGAGSLNGYWLKCWRRHVLIGNEEYPSDVDCTTFWGATVGNGKIPRNAWRSLSTCVCERERDSPDTFYDAIKVSLATIVDTSNMQALEPHPPITENTLHGNIIWLQVIPGSGASWHLTSPCRLGIANSTEIMPWYHQWWYLPMATTTWSLGHSK